MRAEQAWQELLEKDDRTSPEDYPEMCLINFEELSEFMNSASGATQTVRSALIDMLSLAKTISPYALSAAAQSRIEAAERAIAGHG